MNASLTSEGKVRIEGMSRELSKREALMLADRIHELIAGAAEPVVFQVEAPDRPVRNDPY